MGRKLCPGRFFLVVCCIEQKLDAENNWDFLGTIINNSDSFQWLLLQDKKFVKKALGAKIKNEKIRKIFKLLKKFDFQVFLQKSKSKNCLTAKEVDFVTSKNISLGLSKTEDV